MVVEHEQEAAKGSNHSDQPPTRTMAAIVLFNPDEDVVVAMVKTLRADVSVLALYLNAPVDDALRSRLEADTLPQQLHWVGSGQNSGLGQAYNDCLDLAERECCDRLILFDQDSCPPAGIVKALNQSFVDLQTIGAAPAAIGPAPVAEDGSPIKAPLLSRTFSSNVESLFIISSGQLVDVALARKVGPFRSDFFIDAIDVEWCLRARATGLSIWMNRSVRMQHELGRGTIVLPIGLRVTRQPPNRVYTFIRNQMAMLRLKHVPLNHKLRFLLSLPARSIVYLLTDRSPAMRAALWQGWCDGLLYRLGDPTHVWQRLGKAGQPPR